MTCKYINVKIDRQKILFIYLIDGKDHPSDPGLWGIRRPLVPIAKTELSTNIIAYIPQISSVYVDILRFIFSLFANNVYYLFWIYSRWEFAFNQN